MLPSPASRKLSARRYHPMRIRTFPIFVFIALFCALVQSVVAQTLPTKTWELPQGTAVKDGGPRTYRFTVDYTTASAKGEIARRQRLTGDYTRGLAGGDVVWKNVVQADADGATAPFAAAQKRDFME